jgi:hypothetical protein
MIQLTLGQYAAWLVAEEKWRLTDDELQLLKDSYGYTRSDRNREMPEEMRYVRNTKAVQYRRVKTFERYLKELERCRSSANKRKPLTHTKDSLNLFSGRLRHKEVDCRYKGLDFDLTAEWLEVKVSECPSCPVCNISFSEVNFEFDRHVPSLGYIQSNVNLLCPTCNRQKSDNTVESLQRLIDYMKG